MLEFFQALVACQLPSLGYNEMLQMLLQPIADLPNTSQGLHKQAYYSLARCVAAITVTCSNQVLAVVEQFIDKIKFARCDTQHLFCDAQHIFSLLVVGEIGRAV